ncbi:MAG TPA: sigma-54 dependent transcriptional regulator [Phycisphaerae bacterium]|jgi:two-component system response regulator PilR (NtrC family)|nr:sigma-54 dependent transcriptional regulator [Phycisphaerae bacterium]
MARMLLIAEDEAVLRESLAELFRGEGFDVIDVGDGKAAYNVLLERTVDVVITDIRMPEMDGTVLLSHIQKICPETPVIVLTAYGTVESAVAAMRAGAVDYLLKPMDFNEVLEKVRRALELRELNRAQKVITERLAPESTFHNLVGGSPSMNKLFDLVRKLSTVRSNVLLVGESGTGKELFARAIHYNGITRDKPFVAVNSGAIPATLIESELFGYRRGAFTGALRDKIGYFEAANGGTLFLDEISTLPVAVQSSLLRVLEERVVVPVGDTHARPINVRIIAASNRDLEGMVKSGEFREDLLYRLNVVKMTLPPLRQRKEDIPALVHHFMDKYMHILEKKVAGITNGAMRALLSHDWRGNVRELENVIERAVIFAEDRQIGVEDLPFAAEGLTDDVSEDLKEALQQFERQHILFALRRHNFDKTETAQHLNIGISSLYRKLDELNIPKSMTEVPTAAATN